jgi:hypothetical protein
VALPLRATSLPFASFDSPTTLPAERDQLRLSPQLLPSLPYAPSVLFFNFSVFDVMLHFVSPHRAEGASPHFPRRGETQNADTFCKCSYTRRLTRSATGRILIDRGYRHSRRRSYLSRSLLNFSVFDVMLHFVSPHRAEGASPHFPRRGETQNVVTNRTLQLHWESRVQEDSLRYRLGHRRSWLRHSRRCPNLSRSLLNFFVFDVMSRANSSPRAAGPSPPLPRRSHSGVVTGTALQLKSESRTQVPIL